MNKTSPNSPNGSPKIAFATRYLDAHSTLNAISAISRCENLLDDIAQAKKWMTQFEITGEWFPWFGLEVFSYYKAGLVTCLEWHARSRLVDLLRFKPSAIQTEDLKGNIGDKVLSEMVAAGVDIPGLVGASRLVNSRDGYFAIFRRIFGELSITTTDESMYTELQLSSHDKPADALQELFEARHVLVHEITMGEIGPWIARNNVHLHEIEETGKLVLALIKLIEREISAYGPAEFPNRLTLEGYPADQNEYLDREISRLEDAIYQSLEVEPEQASWRKEIAASAQSQQASLDFIESCQIAGQRYFDYKGEMVVELRKERLQHLRRVAENLGID